MIPYSLVGTDSLSVSRSSPSMRGCILRYIHYFLLQSFPHDQVYAFWKDALRSSRGEDSDVHAFLDSVVHRNEKLPIDFVIRVLSTFEPFLLKRGQTFNTIVRSIFSNVANAHPANYQLCYRTFLSDPGADAIANGDFRSRLLRESCHTLKIICKNFHLDVINSTTQPGARSDIVMAALAGAKGLYPPPAFDCEQWIGMNLKTMPVPFLLPEFEEVRILADVRAPAAIVSRPTAGIRLKRRTFRDFMERFELRRVPYIRGVDDHAELFEAQEDYECPTRKRIVLHKGCYYRAPAYFFNVNYSESDGRNLRDIFYAYSKNVKKDLAIEARLKSLHDQFLHKTARTCLFLYDQKAETLYHNGKYCTRHIPAKILRKLIAKHVQDGTTEFERRWLLADQTIVPDPTNSCLERRFQLILQALEKICPACHEAFSRPERGKIVLVPRHRIALEEV